MGHMWVTTGLNPMIRVCSRCELTYINPFDLGKMIEYGKPIKPSVGKLMVKKSISGDLFV